MHQMRVAIRRLRELLPALALDDGRSRRTMRALRRVARRLGPLRELDVLVVLVASPPWSRAASVAMETVADRLHNARRAVRKRVVDRQWRDRLDRLVKRLGKLAREVERRRRPTRGSWTSILEARVARRAARARRAVQAGGAIYLPERLHDVRIAVKKLRYALELAGEATMTVPAADLETLRRGQRLLGQLRDAQALADYLRGSYDVGGTPTVVTWRAHDGVGGTIDRHCRRLHAQYVRLRAAVLTVCDRWADEDVGLSRRAG